MKIRTQADIAELEKLPVGERLQQKSQDLQKAIDSGASQEEIEKKRDALQKQIEQSRKDLQGKGEELKDKAEDLKDQVQ